ncbi:MAG TPA: RNA methyltransferase [Pyrinomonadaceae bacterium]
MITSRDNQLIKRARAVRDGKLREQIFIEGLRLCAEAAQALRVDDITDVIYSERILEDVRGAELLDSLQQHSRNITLASEAVFASLSDTKTPQGIVLLAVRPKTSLEKLLEKDTDAPLLLVLHKINNPSNAGAILRTAEAAGVTGVILTQGSADIFSPKALRGAMGSTFRLKIWTGASFVEAIDFCQTRRIRTFSAELHGEHAHTEIDWTRPCALVVGSEASGLKPSEINATDESLRIPMRPPVESLNVAVATGVVLYEAARQRGVSSEQ